MHNAIVIGAGLAGSEAAWQLAQRGIHVDLYEMKPVKMTPAHHSSAFAELCCSNSLRGAEICTAPGLLKEELRRAGSLIISCADATRVEAGGALAVDREAFANLVTEKVKNHPNITVHEGEVTEIPAEGHVIVATGPLTSDALFESIHNKLGAHEYLHFYDAAAPIVSFESVDMDSAYFASRYDKGTADYINCPMNREQYDAFWEALCEAEQAPVHGFEDKKVFEGCMPVDVMGRRGHDTLLYGPLKPVGLRDPHTGETPYAVVQLRRDNAAGSLYNLVGFQTHLTFPEQRRVFRMIPGLEKAEFFRYGVMHRNTFLNSPQLLQADYSMRGNPNVFFAGQMTGVEGYIESAASGYAAGLAAAFRAKGMPAPIFPEDTMIGAMARYVSHGGSGPFQLMNANFGIIPPLGYKLKGGRRPRYEAYARRALESLENFRFLLPQSNG